MATLTQRRILSAGQGVLDQVEQAYETVFARGSADDEFFEGLESAYLAFLKQTAKRPLKVREIGAAERIFRDACRDLMRKAKERVRARA